MTKYYDGTELLNKKDLDNKEPNIYISTSNRSAGKTTFFMKKLLSDYVKDNNCKFALLFRNKYEMKDSHKIFGDVQKLYPELDGKMESKPQAEGIYYAIFYEKEICGFAISLSQADKLKKYSSVFRNVTQVVMDEFQSEQNKYLKDEIQAFQSVYVSIARGGGYQSRNVKIYLLGNMISVMNPYFIAFGIHKRLTHDNIKFLRGNGWVAEFSFNASASNSIKGNSFFRAFQNSQYMKYSTDKIYLYDTSTFISKPPKKARYFLTIKYDGKYYGVRECIEEGFVHISKSYDKSFKRIAVFKEQDHNQNTLMLRSLNLEFKYLKSCFMKGILRFDDLATKNVIYDILSIDYTK